jgi:hypothetical protein
MQSFNPGFLTLRRKLPCRVVKNSMQFTLPTTISGRGHQIFHKEGTCNTSIIFESDTGNEFGLDVCVQMN